MKDKIFYECQTCNSKLELEAGDHNHPKCCNTPMKSLNPIQYCSKATVAEHSRFDDIDDPCDDCH